MWIYGWLRKEIDCADYRRSHIVCHLEAACERPLISPTQQARFDCLTHWVHSAPDHRSELSCSRRLLACGVQPPAHATRVS